MITSEKTGRSFLKFAAYAAAFAVITTLLNTQMHRFYPEPGSFDEWVLLVHDEFYMTNQWVLLVHPFGTLLLAVGVFFVAKEKSYGFVLAGLLFALIEKILEFVGQTIQLFTVNLNWATAYLSTTNANEKERLKTFITGFNGIWNDCYFVLWVSYILSSIFFAIALKDIPESAWVRRFLYGTAFITGIMLVSDYGKQAWLSPLLPIFYPASMIGCRLLIAVFLFRKSDSFGISS